MSSTLFLVTSVSDSLELELELAYAMNSYRRVHLQFLLGSLCRSACCTPAPAPFTRTHPRTVFCTRAGLTPPSWSTSASSVLRCKPATKSCSVLCPAEAFFSLVSVCTTEIRCCNFGPCSVLPVVFLHVRLYKTKEPILYKTAFVILKNVWKTFIEEDLAGGWKPKLIWHLNKNCTKQPLETNLCGYYVYEYIHKIISERMNNKRNKELARKRDTLSIEHRFKAIGEELAGIFPSGRHS